MEAELQQPISTDHPSSQTKRAQRIRKRVDRKHELLMRWQRLVQALHEAKAQERPPYIEFWIVLQGLWCGLCILWSSFPIAGHSAYLEQAMSENAMEQRRQQFFNLTSISMITKEHLSDQGFLDRFIQPMSNIDAQKRCSVIFSLVIFFSLAIYAFSQTFIILDPIIPVAFAQGTQWTTDVLLRVISMFLIIVLIYIPIFLMICSIVVAPDFLVKQFYEWRRKVRYSDAVIADSLMYALSILEVDSNHWRDQKNQKSILQRLEIAADCLQHYRTSNLLSKNDGANEWHRERSLQTATALRELQNWVREPLETTRGDLIERIARDFIVVVKGNFGELPCQAPIHIPKPKRLVLFLGKVGRISFSSGLVFLAVWGLQQIPAFHEIPFDILWSTAIIYFVLQIYNVFNHGSDVTLFTSILEIFRKIKI